MKNSKISPETIAIIGGTGALGSGLAYRCARAGLSVAIGSRNPAKAEQTARLIADRDPSMKPAGGSNDWAAEIGDIVIVTVPFASQSSTLRAIQPLVSGKLVVDTTVPLLPPRVSRVQLPREGSAAVLCQELLGGSARVVSAFHNVSASKMSQSTPVDCDVLVFGDDPKDRDKLVGLIEQIGMRGIHGGALVNSAAAEAMTSVLISINRQYKVADGSGIRITGLESEPLHEGGNDG